MTQLSTNLRQWCRRCQRATSNIACETCGAEACAGCGDHGAELCEADGD